MNILFLGYWGANDGLSQATINPHLQILAREKKVGKIIYVSIERNTEANFNIPVNDKIEHFPYQSLRVLRFINKLSDFVFLPAFVTKLINAYNVDLIICRSAIAGGIGHLAHIFSRVPYVVESFEPHSEYMRELKIWKRWSISYQIQYFLERLQIKSAYRLFTVSNHYRKFLIGQGLSAQHVYNVPCAVNLEKFQFDIADRNAIRNQLGIKESTTVGIYIGKFGDIYLDHEAFVTFKKAFDYYQDFFLILLTPHHLEFIERRIKQHHIPTNSVHTYLAKHEEVPSFLSAADFAFSTIRPSHFRRYCCPTKNGEYWANGLGIVSTEDIGDDSAIIEQEKGGIIITSNRTPDWKGLKTHMLGHMKGNGTQRLASKYRSFTIVEEAYKSVLNNWS